MNASTSESTVAVASPPAPPARRDRHGERASPSRCPSPSPRRSASWPSAWCWGRSRPGCRSPPHRVLGRSSPWRRRRRRAIAPPVPPLASALDVAVPVGAHDGGAVDRDRCRRRRRRRRGCPARRSSSCCPRRRPSATAPTVELAVAVRTAAARADAADLDREGARLDGGPVADEGAARAVDERAHRDATDADPARQRRRPCRPSTVWATWARDRQPAGHDDSGALRRAERRPDAASVRPDDWAWASPPAPPASPMPSVNISMRNVGRGLRQHGERGGADAGVGADSSHGVGAVGGIGGRHDDRHTAAGTAAGRSPRVVVTEVAVTFIGAARRHRSNRPRRAPARHRCRWPRHARRRPPGTRPRRR